MEAFLISTGIVALAEIGDKTQLFLHSCRQVHRKPWPSCWAFWSRHWSIALAGVVGGMADASDRTDAGAGFMASDSLRWPRGYWCPTRLTRMRRTPGWCEVWRVQHHRDRLLPRRDGRPNADRHRRAGHASLTRCRRRHHARHDAGQCACSVHRHRLAEAAGAPVAHRRGVDFCAARRRYPAGLGRFVRVLGLFAARSGRLELTRLDRHAARHPNHGAVDALRLVTGEGRHERWRFPRRCRGGAAARGTSSRLKRLCRGQWQGLIVANKPVPPRLARTPSAPTRGSTFWVKPITPNLLAAWLV